MKRFVSAVLVIVILFSASIAYATDFSSISDEELNTLFHSIRNELDARRLKAEKKVFILDQEGIQIYIDGSPTLVSSSDELIIPIVIINNNEKNIHIGISEAAINGWMTSGSLTNYLASSGKKRKSELKLYVSDIGIESLEDLEDFELCFTVYDSDTYDFDRKVIDKSKSITVYAAQIK